MALAVPDDDDVLSAEELEGIREHVSRSRAASTVKAYKSHLRGWARWCEDTGRMSTMPAKPKAVSAYLSALAKKGASVRTIDAAAAALRYAHAQAGHASPTDTPLVKATLSGIRRDEKYNKSPVKKTPVTLDDLRCMLSHVNRETLTGKRDAALLLTGFSCGLRRSELTGLLVSDVRFKRGVMTIELHKTKTDQTAEGYLIDVPEMSHDPAVCPVAAMREWLTVSKITGLDAAVFVSVDQWGHRRDRPLTGQVVSTLIKALATKCGLEAREFGAHSLRRGLVTSATEAGQEPAKTAKITRQTLATIQGYMGHNQRAQREVLKAVFGAGVKET
jgi:site-specific recombinase XerD